MPRAFLHKKDLYSAAELAAAMELAFPNKPESVPAQQTKCPSHPANLSFFPSPNHPWPPIGLPTASVASAVVRGQAGDAPLHRQPLAPKNPDAGRWLNTLHALPPFSAVYLPLPLPPTTVTAGHWSLPLHSGGFAAAGGTFGRQGLQTISNLQPVLRSKPLTTPFDIDTILGNAGAKKLHSESAQLDKIDEECSEMDQSEWKTSAPVGGRRGSCPRYQCGECKKSYSTVSGLSKHREFHCSVLHQQSFQCSAKSCNRLYGTIGALKMHMRTHTLPNQCTVCGRRFSRPWLLQGHMRTHSGEKPFQCPQCMRPFADRSNLRAHLQTHADIKKYKCQLCLKTFSRMSLLNKHQSGTCRPHRPRTASSLEGTLV